MGSILVSSMMRSATGFVSSLSLLLLPLVLSQESSRLHRGVLSSSGRRGILTRVVLEQPGYEEHIEHVVHRVRIPGRRKRRRRIRPVSVVPAEVVHPVAGFEGSYVAVSGTPGRGAVHVVEDVPSLGRESVVVVNGIRTRGGHRDTALVPVAPPPVAHPTVLQPARPVPVQPVAVPARIPVPATPVVPVATSAPARPITGDRLPLPKCSYINTDFPGDDIILEGYNQPGVNAGSARACKARCRLEETCIFWSYKEGFSRDTETLDCFLKEGTPGLPVPREAVPRLGFVSGTQDNNCVCIKSEDEEDEVCPIKEPRGLVYPWRSLDEEENDLEQGLPPLGWNRGVYGTLDPRLGPILGGGIVDPGLNPLPGERAGLESTVRALQAQIDDLSRRLGSR